MGHAEDDKTFTQWADISLAARLSTLQRDLDVLLAELIPDRAGPAGRLSEAMRYAVIGGGKRLRSLLCVSVAELVGAPYVQALRVSAAIECIHAQSLIHDDLPCMDDDDMRRGKPTVHRAFDEATAVLAGDALLALAFEILADEATHPDAVVRATLVSALARTIGQNGLAAGQMLDLYPQVDASREQLLECEMLKTGTLIRFAAEAGSILGQCDSSTRSRLLRYADLLGLAFQLRDDVLDRIGQAEVVGKRLNKDADAGRQSAVQVLGLGEAQRQTEMFAKGCVQELAGFGGKARMLSDIAVFAASRMH